MAPPPPPSSSSNSSSGSNPSDAPRAAPLTTVEELLSWAPGSGGTGCRTHVPLHIPDHVAEQRRRRPQLLVCHDMMNGYHDDALLQGCQDPGFYRIWHWHCIDVFVYFSHHLVTVPPPGWCDVAHRNGVQVCERLL